MRLLLSNYTNFDYGPWTGLGLKGTKEVSIKSATHWSAKERKKSLMMHDA